MNRKEWKKSAKGAVKRHYVLFVFLCLFMAMLGLSYTGSISPIKSAITGKDTDAVTEQSEGEFQRVFEAVVLGDVDDGYIFAEKSAQEITDAQRKLGLVSVGHSRGVLSQLVVNTSSGMILINFVKAVGSIAHSQEIGIIVLIIVSLFVVIFVFVYIFDVINVVNKRIFLEARVYNSIPLGRFLFLQRVRKWSNVAKVILLRHVFSILWGFTIVGGVIKKYSYYMVPYILAENPAMGARETITLSRKMMKGHKWECFVLSLSFIGWHILDAITFGVSGIFYTNPYQEATYAEYYRYIRNEAKKNNIPGAEKLNDRYLFEKPEQEVVNAAYSDVEIVGQEAALKAEYQAKNFRQKLGDALGICLFYNEREIAHESSVLQEERQRDVVRIKNREQYPGRLFTIPEKEKVKQIEHINYLRRYSVPSLILIFFTMCFIGWAWEVSLHLVSDGEFVNRGVMHGPWLPIYGAGGVLILVVLNKLRKNLLVQFVSAIVLCGILEYFSGWYLEVTHNGVKWWDYSGYFLNIDGRVCAEGLLVFGLGGIVIVYLMAPLLDNLFRRIPGKIVIPICLILLLSYNCDMIYSQKHPNVGKGVTDTADTEVLQE